MQKLLVTGATGLVGGHVAERAIERGHPTRALVRSSNDATWLEKLGVELVRGDMTEPATIEQAITGVDWIVHCAAKVGDWGKLADYRRVNVEGLETLLSAARRNNVQRIVYISSLGVYPPRHHYGTDETEPPDSRGLDGYARSKVEAERLVLRHIQEHGLAAVILRPGFIYGPRDRTILPRLIERLQQGVVVFFGSGQQLMNNTYVGNLVDGIFLGLENPQAVGQIYNVTDGHLVSKHEFVATVAELIGRPVPRWHLPLWLAWRAATVMETWARLLGRSEAPLLSKARVKFLGLNLQFSIEKARRELGYQPRWQFRQAMEESITWFRQNGFVPPSEPAPPAAVTN